MSFWRFKLIGKFTAISPDNQIVKFPGRKHEALVAYLLLSKRRSVTREELLTLLWGSRSRDQARDSLKGVLYQVTQTLQQHGELPIDRDRTHIYLTDSEKIVDVWSLQSLSKHTSIEEFEEHTELLDAELLESLTIREEAFEEWIEAARLNLVQLTGNALNAFGQKLFQTQRYDECSKIANRMLLHDGADESAHRLLMQSYHAAGKKALAVQQYRRCVDVLREKLNTTVSAETQKLFIAINTQEVSSSNSAEPEKPAHPLSIVRSGKSLTTQEVTLAVVPFAVESGSDLAPQAGSELVEEIIGACARFKWFRVLPSVETSRKELIDKSLAEIRKVIAAKYMLNGHFRSSGSKIVLSTELVDVETSNVIWSHKFDFSDRSEISTGTIVPLLASYIDNKLRANEIKCVYGVREEEYTGYECALRAIANLYDLDDRDSYQVTETLFERAVKTNPNIAWFYSLWSLWKMYSMGQQWVDNVKDEFEKAGNLARQAIKRDADDALAHAINGHYMTFWLRRNEEGRIALDRSLRLNPYSSFALLHSAVNYAYGGQAKEALSELTRTRELCEIENHFKFMYDSAHCIAYLINREPDKAAKWGYAAVHENPGFTNGYKQLLIALGHLEDSDACQQYLQKLMTLEPKFKAKTFLDNYPLVRQSDKEYFMEGLIKAGAPANGNGGKVQLRIV